MSPRPEDAEAPEFFPEERFIVKDSPGVKRLIESLGWDRVREMAGLPPDAKPPKFTC